MNRTLTGALVAIGIAGGATAPQAATLIGNSIQAAYFFPDIGNVYPLATVLANPFTVGDGVDTTIDVEGVTFLQIDFSASSLVITLDTVLSNPTWSAVAQNGPSFTVLSGDPFPAIASVVASNAGPVIASVIGGDLVVNWAGMSYLDGDTVTIQFADAVVPLPASFGLLAFGLAAFGWAARRRRAI